MLRSLCASLFVVAMVARAEADPSSAQAEALFRQARALMAQHKFAQACAAFEASQKLEPSIATLLNEANCREKNGQLATAWGMFIDAARQTRTASDARSVQFHKIASQRATALEPKLSKLTVVVGADAKLDGLVITRNGEAIDPGTWNLALPVDGGTYTLAAKAPGHEAWTTSITVGASGDNQAATVPRLAEALHAPTLPAVAAASAPAPSLAVTSAARPHRSKVVPVALTVGAVALVGGAVGFDLWGDSTYKQAKAEPDDAKQNALWQSANHKRYVAEGLATAGIACAGVAVWLFVRSGGTDRPRTAARGVTVAPLFATGGGGLLLDARY